MQRAEGERWWWKDKVWNRTTLRQRLDNLSDDVITLCKCGVYLNITRRFANGEKEWSYCWYVAAGPTVASYLRQKCIVL